MTLPQVQAHLKRAADKIKNKGQVDVTAKAFESVKKLQDESAKSLADEVNNPPPTLADEIAAKNDNAIAEADRQGGDE